MFEVGHHGDESLTWSGDIIPEHESAIVIGLSSRLPAPSSTSQLIQSLTTEFQPITSRASSRHCRRRHELKLTLLIADCSPRYNDYLFVQGLAIRVGMLGQCKYFAKKQLVWQIPFFGIGFWLSVPRAHCTRVQHTLPPLLTPDLLLSPTKDRFPPDRPQLDRRREEDRVRLHSAPIAPHPCPSQR